MTAALPRAMILAAGYGTRLKPLSDLLPKPLVPVANRPLIDFPLALLKKAGLREVAINLHHLGKQVPTVLGTGQEHGLEITYSHEDTILGTGGGVARMRSFLSSGTFVLLNGDILTGIDLMEVLRFHRERGAAATMVVRPLPREAAYTPLWVDDQGWLVAFKDVSRSRRGGFQPLMFEGIHVLEPVVFDFLPKEGFACIVDQAYSDMLKKGMRVAAFLDTAPWFDLGTPALYLSANRALLSGRARFPQLDPVGPGGLPDGVLLGESVEMGAEVRLGPEVAVGAGCSLGDGATVARSVLWPGARVEKGARLDGVILAGPHRVQT